MLRGLYNAAGGMISQQVAIDTISNNMANSETTGFKRDVTVMSAFQQELMYHFDSLNPTPNRAIGSLPYGVEVAGSEISYKQGSLQWTGGSLDVAIEGDGFFAVQAPEGIRLTRNGAFKVDDQNYLVTGQGYRVLGYDDFIIVNGRDIAIKEDGTVLNDGVEVGRIALMDFEDRSAIRKEGDGLFSAPDDLDPILPQARLKQGYLESSNVDMTNEMSGVIVSFRAYEANSKVLQSFDQLMQLAVERIGTLR